MVQSGDDYQSGPKQVQTLVLPVFLSNHLVWIEHLAAWY